MVYWSQNPSDRNENPSDSNLCISFVGFPRRSEPLSSSPCLGSPSKQPRLNWLHSSARCQNRCLHGSASTELPIPPPDSAGLRGAPHGAAQRGQRGDGARLGGRWSGLSKENLGGQWHIYMECMGLGGAEHFSCFCLQTRHMGLEYMPTLTPIPPPFPECPKAQKERIFSGDALFNSLVQLQVALIQCGSDTVVWLKNENRYRCLLHLSC